MSAQVHQPGDHAIKLRTDAGPLDKLFEESAALLHEIVDRGFRIPDDFYTVKYGGFSADTGEAIVTLEPSDTFLCFLAACRAGNFDNSVVVHDSLPADVRNTSMTEAGGANNPAGGGSALAPQVLP